MQPIYVTTTPRLYKLQFEYHPKMVEIIKRIPSKPRWDGIDRAWLVSIKDDRYPNDKSAQWYVEAFAQWAVQMGYSSRIVRRQQSEDITYDIPEMKGFDGSHYMELTPYPYQLEGVRYGLDHKRCIYGDQPGLGKTLQGASRG